MPRTPNRCRRPLHLLPRNRQSRWSRFGRCWLIKSHDGKTEAVRELLQKYGAPKLSAVDPKHYPALLKDAEVL